MSNQHRHGAFAAHIIADRDLTPHTNSLSFTPSLDTSEDTNLQPEGSHKTFLQGLGGSAASSAGFAVNDPDFLHAEMAHLFGDLREVEPVTFAWFGAQVGSLVTLARARKTAYNVPVSNSSVITTAISHSCDAAYRLGTALHSPYGGMSYTGGEVQALTFTNAPVAQFLALRLNGRTETFEFRAAASNAALKAGIDGLLAAVPALSGVVSTVTGALTGTDLKSGVRQVAFSGTLNVPQLEIVTGAVRRRQVVDGNGGNYSFDGGAGFTLPITQANFDANQKAIGGAYAGSVSIGASAPLTFSASVSGAGDASFNGDYFSSAPYLDSKPTATNANGRKLFNNGYDWVLDEALFNTDTGQAYTVSSGSVPLPSSGNATLGTGTGPAPAVTIQVHSGAGFTTYFPLGASPATPTSTARAQLKPPCFLKAAPLEL